MVVYGWKGEFGLKDVEKVANDIYMIKQMIREGNYVTVLVFVGKSSIGVVDSGFEKTPTDYIFPLVKELGRGLSEINLVVNTHRDGDHIQGNRVIKENTKAKIAAHELEVEAIPEVDVKLKDGETIELGDRKFKVIHTPGHRPGAICLYDSKSHLLITDDVVCGERKDLIRMDKTIYISSLRKLLKLEVSQLIMGHPFKPMEKPVLTGDEPRRMIEASIDIAEKM